MVGDPLVSGDTRWGHAGPAAPSILEEAFGFKNEKVIKKMGGKLPFAFHLWNHGRKSPHSGLGPPAGLEDSHSPYRQVLPVTPACADSR